MRRDKSWVYGTSLEHTSPERQSGRLLWSFRRKIRTGVKMEENVGTLEKSMYGSQDAPSQAFGKITTLE